MSLREDFRNALGSIAAAVPEAVRTMRHGETEQGAVVQSSSRDFAEAVSDAAPAEAARYVANAADFPTLEEGSAVELDGSLRVVVSMKTDPARSTLKVGLSRELDVCSIGRDVGADGKAHGAIPFRCIAQQTGRDSDIVGARPSFDGAARVAWTIHVPRGEWPFPGDPQIGRRLVLSRQGCANASMTVRGAEFRNGVWRLLCAQDSRLPDWGA